MQTFRPEFAQPAPVIFGCGAISVLGERVRGFNCKKVMVIFDKGVEDLGVAKKVTDALDAQGVDYITYNGVVPDPPVSVVNEAGKLALEHGVDCLVGVGGGSSMDTAKAVAIYLYDPVPVEKYITQIPPVVPTTTPVILVATTAGTGSECTRVAIISRPELNVKWSAFVNTSLAIVDPELTVTLPKAETANTGLDAFSHAAEAMTTIFWNYHSNLYGEAAIRKICKNLVCAWNEPENIEARSEMALAANWAGLAFNNPITHVGHASADAFSCHFHTTHGHGCALALPEAMAFVAPAMPERMRTIAEAMGISVTGSESGEKLGAMVADGIRELMHRVKIQPLRELGYTRDKVIALAGDVVENHLSTYCPVEVTRARAEYILGRIYDTY
ncbi:MAG: iron-containing alcohol dehydrogenase [Oscillospiraceae bacterium]|jgi:1,3-propanediol dehydrogenase|nr:iron-containing alcohol dehydrogenase [Oscillospiraceae bacterium]